MTTLKPVLSVIVPTFNRREQLRGCLKALLEQDIDSAQYEIIVVVDGATDGTEGILSTVKAQCQYRFISQPNQGPAAARNHGLGVAQGQIAVFVDDDMLVNPGFLRAHLVAHNRHPGSAIVGSVETIAGNLIGPAFAVYKTLQSRQLNHLADSRLYSPFDLLAGNLSIGRDLLLRLGNFDESLPLCEDFDLALRLLSSNVPIWYCSEAKSKEVYTRGAELITRDSYYRGIAHGKIATKYARASILLDFRRFFRGSRIIKLARILTWLFAPAFFSSLKRPADISFLSTVIKWIVERPRLAHMIGGVMYWSGLKKSLRTLSELKRLAMPRLVVLGYHMVEDNLAKPFAPYGISTAQFRWQMNWLYKNGYQTISLVEWLSFCRGEIDIPRKSICVTFDDGYEDLIDRVAPILHLYSFHPVVFIVAGAIGAHNLWDLKSGFPSRKVVNAEDLRFLLNGGAEIESHSYSHRSLPTLTQSEQESELALSKSTLESILNRPVKILSYPYGMYSSELIELAKKVGYDAACCSSAGWNYVSANPYAIRRDSISSRTTKLGFILHVKFPRVMHWASQIARSAQLISFVAQRPNRIFTHVYRWIVIFTRPFRAGLYARADSIAALAFRLCRIRRFGEGYFERKFRNPDPWRFAEREYERNKYRETLDVLTRVYNRVLEIGCAEGIFTEMLASHGREIIGIDISKRALERARSRCSGLSNVSFLKLDILQDPLPNRFDLVVCGEVLCFAETRQKLAQVCRKVAAVVEPQGRVLLVHLRIAKEHVRGWSADDLTFGADSIHPTFETVSNFKRVFEQWNDLYAISMFENETIMHRETVGELAAPTPLSGGATDALVMNPTR